ncbi:MAG: hypothetical protein KAJ14_09395, partial [Candidatus Omnitrophica bacterium]|nr:hypothetical protein [Candidatus Omnitrophota bacterium]
EQLLKLNEVRENEGKSVLRIAGLVTDIEISNSIEIATNKAERAPPIIDVLNEIEYLYDGVDITAKHLRIRLSKINAKRIEEGLPELVTLESSSEFQNVILKAYNTYVESKGIPPTQKVFASILKVSKKDLLVAVKALNIKLVKTNKPLIEFYGYMTTEALKKYSEIVKDSSDIADGGHGIKLEQQFMPLAPIALDLLFIDRMTDMTISSESDLSKKLTPLKPLTPLRIPRNDSLPVIPITPKIPPVSPMPTTTSPGGQFLGPMNTFLKFGFNTTIEKLDNILFTSAFAENIIELSTDAKKISIAAGGKLLGIGNNIITRISVTLSYGVARKIRESIALGVVTSSILSSFTTRLNGFDSIDITEYKKQNAARITTSVNEANVVEIVTPVLAEVTVTSDILTEAKNIVVNDVEGTKYTVTLTTGLATGKISNTQQWSNLDSSKEVSDFTAENVITSKETLDKGEILVTTGLAEGTVTSNIVVEAENIVTFTTGFVGTVTTATSDLDLANDVEVVEAQNTVRVTTTGSAARKISNTQPRKNPSTIKVQDLTAENVITSKETLDKGKFLVVPGAEVTVTSNVEGAQYTLATPGLTTTGNTNNVLVSLCRGEDTSNTFNELEAGMVSAPIYFCSKGVETGAGVVVSRLLQPIVLSSQFPVSSSRPIITIPDGGSENKVVDMSKVGKGTVLYFIALIIAKFLVWIASCIVGLISPATNKNGYNKMHSLTKQLDTGKENNPYSTEAPFNLPVVPVTLPNLPMEKGYKSMFKQFNGVLPSLFIFINNKLNISETLKSNRGVKTLFKNSLPVIRGPPLVVILIVLSLALVALVSNPDNLVVLSSVNIPPFYPLTEAVTVMFAVACSYIIYRVASGLIVASHDV